MEFSPDLIQELEKQFQSLGLHRPMRVNRYDEGRELRYEVTAVEGGQKAEVRLLLDKFIGGGYAGQVYRVTVLEITPDSIPGLAVNGTYAMKILIPPTGFSRLFRNALYRIGFQGAFQPQVNPAAARSGALWQKFIRRGAHLRFKDENAVRDIHATFVDGTLGSCGELSDWIEGRTWRLEVDDHVDLLGQWARGKAVDQEKLGSPEYRAKYEFMHCFVELLHDMGAHEFARQYEWSTWKSQPNCLKRSETEHDPSRGLIAADFRAGLTLLPFLPMSPGDIVLIFKGLMRGSLVQFDRGSVSRLEKYVRNHKEEFAGMDGMLEELKECERTYRDSLPDITHNHFRLLFSPRLWKTILDSAVTGWRIRNGIDDRGEQRLRGSRAATLVFMFL
jgi:hypothetical protein